MNDLKKCIANTKAVLDKAEPFGEISEQQILDNQIAIMEVLCGDCGHTKKADMRILEMIQDRAAKRGIYINGLVGLTDFLRSLFPEYYYKIPK